ncbi:diguanylate cyclase [Xylophilus rhododendri]|uniref:diguanylate cyclase n=1 Tax=Xylophilus rhododendri TaxID=2697032 RepID=A0A857JAI1_9BURK|nr:sensor domain-containing diguanylate cyclase [Xylophilus rhododendri]QHJ00224.1 diguanylate cyclase [Xylophilus rhododendri]
MSQRDRDRERLELALDAAGLDLWENNLVTGEVIQHAARTFRELGYPDEEVPQLVANSLDLVHEDDRDRLGTALGELLAGSTADYRCEFRLRARTGDWVWYANHGRVMEGEGGRPGERFVGVTFNIDERKRRETELADIYRQLEEQNQQLHRLIASLELLAATDALTGLANRRTLMESSARECKRAERYGHALAMLLVDIDRFKDINDRWGHLVGDHVICAAAELCRQGIRQGVDIAARLGGEEFVLLLPETDGRGAMALADKLRLAMAGHCVADGDGQPVPFTVSIGVASFEPGLSHMQLLHHADKALYRAKHQGRNRVHRFEDVAAG